MHSVGRLLLTAACTFAMVQCSSAAGSSWQPLQVHATIAQQADEIASNARLVELATALPALLEVQAEVCALFRFATRSSRSLRTPPGMEFHLYFMIADKHCPLYIRAFF